MKKIISIVGARPQFIKYAPLSIELQKSFEDICIHTGQHYDDKMSQIFFDELGITKPKYNLNIGPGTQGAQTGKMIEGIETILLKEKPDAIIVFGDTTSTLSGALAASKIGVKIIHIEAGLRSYNRNMPEEINRVLTDHISSMLFSPTEDAVQNLKNEGISENIFITGDLMIDTQKMGLEYLNENKDEYNLKLPNVEYYLATIHRNYNTDSFERLSSIISELDKLGRKIILPIHPRTSNLLKLNGYDFSKIENIEFIEPKGYFDFLNLLRNCQLVITDSGGLQKEAYAMKKQCITVRYETEWVETLMHNWNTLIPDLTAQKIQEAIDIFEEEEADHQNFYGTGRSSIEIVSLINNFL